MTREEAIDKVYGMSGTKEQHEALDFLVPEICELREFYDRQQENERIRKIITDSVFYQYGAGVEYKDVLDYLDKLEKQKEQNSAEWNEEDEVLRVRTINRLETLNYHGITGKEIRESIDWLKSLRLSWKPSEEQMKALESCGQCNKQVYSLYLDLKKL